MMINMVKNRSWRFKNDRSKRSESSPRTAHDRMPAAAVQIISGVTIAKKPPDGSILRKRLYPLQASAAAAGASSWRGHLLGSLAVAGALSFRVCPLGSSAAAGPSLLRGCLLPSSAATGVSSWRSRLLPSSAANGASSWRGCLLALLAATGASFCRVGVPHCAQNLAPLSNSLPQLVQNLLVSSMQLPFFPVIWSFLISGSEPCHHMQQIACSADIQ